MKGFKSLALALILAPVLLTGAIAAVPVDRPLAGHQSHLEFSEAWKGVWESTRTEFDCDTGEIDQVVDDTFTICPGDVYDPEFETEGDFNCDGSVTDTSFDIECTGTEEVFPGCTATFHLVTSATRVGDTVTSTTTRTIEFLPACMAMDQCWTSETISTRIDPDPTCTITPAEGISWGMLKSVYK